MVTPKNVWHPDTFRTSLERRGLTLADVWRDLVRDLGEDAPTRTAVYKWTREGSGGPHRRAWRRALARTLKRRRKRAA